MACTPYIVLPSPVSGWVNQIDGQEFGPYLSRDLALQVAVADAVVRSKAGDVIRLVIQDDHGVVCAERCICEKFGR